jgi:hypothetical protein
MYQVGVGFEIRVIGTYLIFGAWYLVLLLKQGNPGADREPKLDGTKM